MVDEPVTRDTRMWRKPAHMEDLEMTKPMRRPVIAVAAALALTLSGCVASAWQYDSPPAAGTQVDVGGLKLRNFLIIADDRGEAMLVGAITARDEADSVVTMAYASERDDGSFGQGTEVQFAQDIRKGQTVYIDGSSTQFSDDTLEVGRMAKLQVLFSSGSVAELQVPVMSSKHKDFEQTWAEAHA